MRVLSTILLTLVVLGCTNQDIQKAPKGLIQRDSLISLLIDLEIMEAYYEQAHKRPNLYKTTLDSASRQILKDRRFTESQLESTLEYYSRIPDSLFTLYEEALDSINNLVVSNKNKGN